MTNWSETVAFADLPGIDRLTLNGKLASARNDTCRALIGNPRGTYTEHCLPPEDPAFRALVATHDFGPFRATGIRPAITALASVMTDIAQEKPDIFPRLGTAGMLCCRMMRGSATKVSNHAWGCAIDLTIDGVLDDRGDSRTQRGLLEIWPIFNRHGFYWGAAFPTEDAMHFEASEQLIRQWHAAGEFGPLKTIPGPAQTIGDHGAQVLALQQALNRALPTRIEEDGIFGKDTRGALVAFQASHGMKPTGVASEATLQALGLPVKAVAAADIAAA